MPMRTITKMGTTSITIKNSQFNMGKMGVMVLHMEGNSVVSLETIIRIIHTLMENQRKSQDA